RYFCGWSGRGAARSLPLTASYGSNDEKRFGAAKRGDLVGRDRRTRRRDWRSVPAKLLIDCLRFWSCKNLLETRIISHRIPCPPQTKISERDVLRIIRIRDRAGSGKETFDQRDRLVRLADQCINERQIGRPQGAMKCVLAFWLEFDGSTAFSNGILLHLRSEEHTSELQ